MYSVAVSAPGLSTSVGSSEFTSIHSTAGTCVQIVGEIGCEVGDGFRAIPPIRCPSWRGGPMIDTGTLLGRLICDNPSGIKTANV